MPLYSPKPCWAARVVVLLLLLACRIAGAHPAALAPPVATPTNRVLSKLEREQALVEAWSEAADPDAMPVENMTLPVAHYANDRVRALLRAGRALIPSTGSGYIRAQDVVVEIYDETGRLEGILITENCFFDRETSSGYSEGKVRMEQRGIRIRGENMVWNLDTNSAKILVNPEVRFDRFIKGIGDLFK